MRISIRAKLLLYSLVIIWLVGGSIAVFAITQSRVRMQEQFEGRCRSIAVILSSIIFNDVYFLDIHELHLHLNEARVNPDILYAYVTDPNRVVLADDSTATPDRDQVRDDPFVRQVAEAEQWCTVVEDDILRLGGPVLVPDEEPVGYLFLGFSLEQIEAVVATNTVSILQAVVVCVLIFGMIALYLARNLTRPIFELVRASGEIGKGNLNFSLPMRRRDELGVLTYAFNQMRRDLAVLIAREKRRTEELAAMNDYLERAAEKQQRMLSALKRSARRYRHIFENSPIPLWECDFSELKSQLNHLKETGVEDFDAYFDRNPDEILSCLRLIRVINVNKATITLYEAETSREFRDHAERIITRQPPDAVRACLKEIAEDRMFHMEGVNETLKGNEIHIIARSSVSPDYQASWRRVIISIQDLTGQLRTVNEKLRLQEQLQEARRMEAVGTLAGGIAHEFNNALMGISGNIQMLEIKLGEEKRFSRYLDSIRDSMERLTYHTRQLLAYSRAGKLRREHVVLDEMIEQIKGGVAYTLSPSVRFEVELENGTRGVDADAGQMQMVLTALINNAIEACREECRIHVKTEPVCFGQESSRNPGRYVRLSVTDTGVGMDEKTKKRMFDPFFSTKFYGRGLSMAAVYGIVENHGGWIEVESAQGKGTTVSLYLPVVG